MSAIVLLFGDESEALTHPYRAHVWARKGADLRVPAPGQAAKVAMVGVLDWKRSELVVHTSASKRSADFFALLAEIDRCYGPRPGVAMRPVVLVLDNGPIHISKATRAALAARRHWLKVEWLPKYAPEINDIERVWRDLKRHHLAHKTFTGPEGLIKAIHKAVRTLNTERRHNLVSHPAKCCLGVYAQWETILSGTVEQVAEILCDTSERATRLRHSSPFAGVLTEAERRAIYAQFPATPGVWAFDNDPDETDL
ncbi:MAG: IS630 family transposase [Acetobacteraceae bacterium]